MKIGEMFPSKYIKTADLNGKPAVVTIDCVVFEEIKDHDGKAETKSIMYFRESKRGMVLNQTNANEIAIDHGDETDNWVGHKIELYPARVQFGPKMVDAIRVRAPRPPLHGQAHPPADRPVQQHPINSQFVAPPKQFSPAPPGALVGDPEPAGPESYGADPFGDGSKDPNDSIPF